jgi:hypothetical protein
VVRCSEAILASGQWPEPQACVALFLGGKPAWPSEPGPCTCTAPYRAPMRYPVSGALPAGCRPRTGLRRGDRGLAQLQLQLQPLQALLGHWAVSPLAAFSSSRQWPSTGRQRQCVVEGSLWSERKTPVHGWGRMGLHGAAWGRMGPHRAAWGRMGLGIGLSKKKREKKPGARHRLLFAALALGQQPTGTAIKVLRACLSQGNTENV